MNGETAERIEWLVDSGAAALLAAATSIALLQFGASNAYAATGAAVAFAWALYALRSVGPEPRCFALAEFEPLAFEAVELPELLLTDADRLPPAEQGDGELVLDDILAEIAPDSRVVRLFDPTAMPTPGQLSARIDRHLHQAISEPAPPDASQALYDALAELRRSLR